MRSSYSLSTNTSLGLERVERAGLERVERGILGRRELLHTLLAVRAPTRGSALDFSMACFPQNVTEKSVHFFRYFIFNRCEQLL